jgi:hypothetical protein
LPLPRQSLQCHFLAVLFHANTQRLSTMTLLVSSPPRRRYDVHHRNVTALCNAVTRLQHTLPLRHRVLPSYATPFHVRTIPSQCFTFLGLSCALLYSALPMQNSVLRHPTIPLRFVSHLRFTTAVPQDALLCSTTAAPCAAKPQHRSTLLILSALFLCVVGSDGHTDTNSQQAFCQLVNRPS